MRPSSPDKPAGNSRRVVSNQPGVHPGLEARVRRHFATPWRQPLHVPSTNVFAALDRLRREAGADQPIVIDAGCGTGESSQQLAAQHPDALVIGIDRSAARLARSGASEAPRRAGRVLLARMELTTFWRLALAEGWPVSHHYLLYPNPWPKAAQLGRRWHGHPVFPTILALGGILELRSNWRLYVEEFSLSLGFAGNAEATCEEYEVVKPALTPFERKYHGSGHPLWRLRYKLP